MHINAAGLALIKEFEKGPQGRPALTAYDDGYGKWTIGYGHTGSDVIEGVRLKNEAEAEALLMKDLAWAEKLITQTISRPLNSNQFSACVCLAFNIGAGNWRNKCSVPIKINGGDYAGAAKAFDKWINAGGKPSKGLIARRKAERALFETPCPEVEDPDHEC